MNDGSRYQGGLKTSYDKIKEPEGTIVECKNATKGKFIWKVVEKVTEDELKEVREIEEDLFSNKRFNKYNI